jgi:ribonucleoside-diphosphate reductase subunit M2
MVTPSKVAAAALSGLDLNIISSKSDTPLLSKLKAVQNKAGKPTVLEQPSEEKNDVELFRKRFVGDLECSEADEPLLKESKTRFVLFPIKYREVSNQ